MSGLSSSSPSQPEQIIQLQNELAWAKLKILSLEAQLRLQRIKKYGPGSEKLDSAQLELLELEPGVSRLAHLLHHVGGSRSFPSGCGFENGLVTRFLSA